MSDEIRVRVRLDRFDFASVVRQTQVYVQIPEVARASWLLDASLYEQLRNEEWCTLLDLVHAEWVKQATVLDRRPDAAAARLAVREWLAVDENRDAMTAAWLEYAGTQTVAGRALLREVKQLREQLAELEAAPTTVYRAEHPDSGITLGHYGTETAARAHCEATERRSWPTGTTLAFDWIEDDGVAELVVTAGQNEESTTGYIVTALEVPSEYDEEADE